METKFDIDDLVKTKSDNASIGVVDKIRIENNCILYNVLMNDTNNIMVYNENEIKSTNPYAEELRELADKIDKGEINVDNFGFNKRGGNKIWSENEVKGQTSTQYIFHMNYKYNKEGE